jgi:hypothetical protein
MSSSLFHASECDLSLGRELTFEDRGLDEGRGLLDEFLERLRPEDCCSRIKAWFACETAALADKYKSAEQLVRMSSKSYNVFEIEMRQFSRHPMVIVNEVYSRLRADDLSVATALANEYWRPTRSWRYIEYIGPTITALRRVHMPLEVSEVAAAGFSYDGDRNRLKSFLQELGS